MTLPIRKICLRADLGFSSEPLRHLWSIPFLLADLVLKRAKRFWFQVAPLGSDELRQVIGGAQRSRPDLTIANRGVSKGLCFVWREDRKEPYEGRDQCLSVSEGARAAGGIDQAWQDGPRVSRYQRFNEKDLSDAVAANAGTLNVTQESTGPRAVERERCYDDAIAEAGDDVARLMLRPRRCEVILRKKLHEEVTPREFLEQTTSPLLRDLQVLMGQEGFDFHGGEHSLRLASKRSIDVCIRDERSDDAGTGGHRARFGAHFHTLAVELS